VAHHLPVTAMVLGSFAVTAMLTKNAFLEEIRKQYVLTARAKGLASARCCGSMCSAMR
jgi:microcin C transport system permease protein